MKIKAIISGLCLIMLSGCLSSPKQSLDALIIQNNSHMVVTDVELRVPETNGIVSCSAILPHFDCSVGFSERENKGHKATLSWTQNGQQYTKPLIGSEKPVYHSGTPHQAIVSIGENGNLNVYLN